MNSPGNENYVNLQVWKICSNLTIMETNKENGYTKTQPLFFPVNRLMEQVITQDIGHRSGLNNFIMINAYNHTVGCS